MKKTLQKARSHSKSSLKARSHVSLLVIIVGLQAVLLLGLLIQTSILKTHLDDANVKISQTNDEIATKTQMLYNEADYQKSLLKPAVLPKENLVVFPELKISLPYNDATKTLQYAVDDQRGVQLLVTSSLLTDHEERQLSCSQLVRVNLQDNNPFSPWEEAAGSTRLADGRTVYVVAARAFKNNEASTEECVAQAWGRIAPQQVVDEFKKARSF